jgi:hypothetical protein
MKSRSRSICKYIAYPLVSGVKANNMLTALARLHVKTTSANYAKPS